jgi:hypothetical protein
MSVAGIVECVLTSFGALALELGPLTSPCVFVQKQDIKSMLIR